MISYRFEHLIKELMQFVKIGSVFIRKTADKEFQMLAVKSKLWTLIS